MVDIASGGDKPWRLDIANEAKRFSRDPESALHFRAYRNIVNILAQRIDQKMVQLMAAIVSDFLTYKARADAQSNRFPHCKGLLTCLGICRLFL